MDSEWSITDIEYVICWKDRQNSYMNVDVDGYWIQMKEWWWCEFVKKNIGMDWKYLISMNGFKKFVELVE